MTMLDDIRRDREAGTEGPWVAEDYTDDDGGPRFYVVPFDYHGTIAQVRFAGKARGKMDANARRIARAPQMEAALLAAEAACELFDGPTSDSDFVNGQATAAQQIRAAIRTALEASHAPGP